MAYEVDFVSRGMTGKLKIYDCERCHQCVLIHYGTEDMEWPLRVHLSKVHGEEFLDPSLMWYEIKVGIP